MTKEELEKKAEMSVSERADKGNFDIEQFDKAYFSESSMKIALVKFAEEQIAELEAQIEKMKCCENCGWYYLQQHWRESKEIDESRMFHCGTCGNKRNWKIKENKE